ncbi:MAG: DUF362 domain-containing protein [Dehalococcoidia bacterium]|nr:DUF362 domain-containing protein [Dehalococcoidia bacterium]
MSDAAIIECNDYSPDRVYEAVKKAVSFTGGIGASVKSGQTVLLKPNLLRLSAPDEAVVTHPNVVGAVARILIDHGAKVIIGDSPGGPFTRFFLEKMYSRTGLDKVARDTGAVLNFNTKTDQVSNINGKLIKRFDIIKAALEVDAVINLPKLKNHGSMRLTGAIKNSFGLVPGLTKSGYHAKLVNADNFGQMLLDLLFMVKPTLNIMDAVVGMEGNGPAAGNPRHIGVLIASRDAIAVDSIAARITGVKNDEIPVLRLAEQQNIPSANVKNINVLGKALDEAMVRDFKPTTGSDRGMGGILAPLINFVGGSMVVNTEVVQSGCDGCGDCYRMCPVEAITINHGKASIDKKMCIRCYCCHEICPQNTIALKKSLLLHLTGVGNRKQKK